MADIFISYSQKDRDRVRLIAEALEGQGMDVFWDPEIPPGETWDSIIARELKSARCVIVAWSESSAESDWVKEEAEFGKRMKALVPVQLDASGPPLGFSRLQTADLSTWNGDPNDAEWLKVLGRVRHHGVDTAVAEPTPGGNTREAQDLRKALYESPQQAAPSMQQSSMASGFAQSNKQQSAQPAAGPSGNSKPASEGFDFANVMFVPTGRIGQKSFWIGFAILFGIAFVGGLATAAVPAVAFVIEMVLLYPSICLYGKRLHDFGMSAWIYGGFRIAMIVVGAVIGGMMGASGAYVEDIVIVTGVLSFLATIAITLWIGLMKSQPTANKHGPPPGGSVPQADVFA
ncbi:MAG: TIR domain-containing protein [Pseudomonadota bacterium]